MKFQKIQLIVVFCLTFIPVNGKTIPSETEKMALTCKVWGFLKYYHPQVACGNYDWDAALIRTLPKVRSAKTYRDLNAIGLEAIYRLGPIPKCEKCDEPDSNWFDENFDLSWTDDPKKFSPEMIGALNHIEENRHQGENYYAMAGQAGQIDASNEKTDSTQIFPDANYRLLELFRFWNSVEYFFPYKYQMSEDWDSTLMDMLPKFISSNDTVSYHLALLELITRVDDSHATFHSIYTRQFFGEYFTPFRPAFIERKAIVSNFINDSVARVTGLHPGDEIVARDGVPMSDIFVQYWHLIPASNAAGKLKSMGIRSLSGHSGSVRLTIRRGDKVFDKIIQRHTGEELMSLYDSTGHEDVAKWTIREDSIGYVNMGVLKVRDVADMMTKMMRCKGIIFDLRNYPNGTMYEICRYLLPKATPFVKFTQPDFTYPGRFIWTNGHRCGTSLYDTLPRYKGNIVLLVNEMTQSHAEFTAMALEVYPRCTVMGSQTAGADGNVASLKLLSGKEVYISGIGIFYPDGRETQRVGIIPDILVKPTIRGIAEGRDEVLERAIELLNTDPG
jgi:carboxyl-terminal processing protease